MSALNKYGEIEDGGCPHCGNPIKPDWVACPECGELLESRRPKPTEAPIEKKTEDTEALFREVNQDLNEYKRFCENHWSTAKERAAGENSTAALTDHGHALDDYRQDHFPSRISAWSKAAKLGCKEAQYLLAICFFGGGYGIAQCETTALSWLRKAANNGQTDAIKYLQMRKDHYRGK